MYNDHTPMEMKRDKRCLALYSGGLDSILAIKVLAEQGIEAIPLYFCTPFFGLDALIAPEPFMERQREWYGLNVHVLDYTDDMIAILKAPRHGYGKHMNPCIDCKIGMLKRARSLLSTMQASFVVTGEVIGQRPMSQRRPIMRAIEKESGLEDILLRPLCARNLPETLPERLGIVDRGRLWDLSGRGRKIQIERARAYGITGDMIPTPAGGCLLTDVQISQRVRKTYGRCSPGLPARADLLLDVVGRRFALDEGAVLIVGRNDGENQVLATFVHPGNVFVRIADVPGPLCVMRGSAARRNIETAAGICLRYGKARGVPGRTAVFGADPLCPADTVEAPVLMDEECRSLQD